MKKLSLLSILFISLSCSKPATPDQPADPLINTTWVRYGFKSPVNGKEVYYYLTFKENNRVEDYIKYNKTELSAQPTSLTYARQSDTKLMLNYSTGALPAIISGNTLTITGPSITTAYTKE